MARDRTETVEDFLVEHVMLGLGNIRTALAGIGPEADPTARDLALRRIEGRIDDIEARARLLLDRLGRPDVSNRPGAETLPRFSSRRRPG